MIPVETVPGMGGEADKWECGGGGGVNSSMIYVIYHKK
jgi:hypothetical protein